MMPHAARWEDVEATGLFLDRDFLSRVSTSPSGSAIELRPAMMPEDDVLLAQLMLTLGREVESGCCRLPKLPPETGR
jgi:hypothetical protein